MSNSQPPLSSQERNKQKTSQSGREGGMKEQLRSGKDSQDPRRKEDLPRAN